MSDIVLTAGVRSNLLQLQKTAELITNTQTKLATGKRVNSALDNPINFFTAQGLTNRASDLGSLLELDVERHQHDPGRQQRHHLDHQAGAVGAGPGQPGAADHRHHGARQPGHAVRPHPRPDRPARWPDSSFNGINLLDSTNSANLDGHAERKRHFDASPSPPSISPRPASRSTTRPTTGRTTADIARPAPT